MTELVPKVKGMHRDNTKTAHRDGSCEWTEGESNPKSKMINLLPAPAGLSPRIHVTSVAVCCMEKQRAPFREPLEYDRRLSEQTYHLWAQCIKF